MAVSMSLNLDCNLLGSFDFKVKNTPTQSLKPFQFLDRLSGDLAKNSIPIIHKGTWGQSDCKPTIVSIFFTNACKKTRPVV